MCRFVDFLIIKKKKLGGASSAVWEENHRVSFMACSLYRIMLRHVDSTCTLFLFFLLPLSFSHPLSLCCLLHMVARCLGIKSRVHTWLLYCYQKRWESCDLNVQNRQSHLWYWFPYVFTVVKQKVNNENSHC